MKCESMSLLPWHIHNKILARSIWVTKESALTTLGKYGSISYAQYLPERGRIAATHVHKTSSLPFKKPAREGGVLFARLPHCQN